jgi:hypothetical protein
LYGHWVNCNEIWHFSLSRNAPYNHKLSSDENEFIFIHSKLINLTIAYGLLYVVIEGYKELNLSDGKINLLLQNREYLNNLKRLRNAVFHFQNKPMPKKLMDFIEMNDSEKWILKLKNDG